MFDDGSGGGGGGRDSADEDDFFKPSSTGSGGKSSLAKIFGLTSSKAASVPDRKNPVSVEAPKSIKVSDRYGPSNFRYIPSTEPDPEEKEQPISEEKSKSAPEWVIVRASIVSAYKLVDNENKFLGKVGLVLLKSSTAHRLLLYRTKSDVLCAATLNSETKLLLKQDYLQFRADETNEFWSILFESESDRAVMLPLIENCCTIEREPLVEEPASEPEKVPEEEPVEQINNNNSNNTGNSNSRKIQLVARMARMGQAIPLPPEKQRLSTDAPPIPSSPPALAGGSDSSDDTSDSKIETIPSRSIPIASRRPNVTHTLNMQMVPLAGMMTTTGTGGHSANSTDVNLNLIMSETRMQNTEVRMNLTKLESKLDRVLDRIDLLSVHGDRGASSALDKDAELLQLEEKVLDLKRDNHSLRAKLQSEQQVAEERRSQHAQLVEKIRSLTEAEETLREEIGALKAKIEANSTDREIANERQHELETKLSNARQNEERKTKELEQTLRELEEQRKKENQLQQELVEQRNRTLEVTAKIELLQQEVESGKGKPESEQASVGSLVKDIMNNCYQQLCDQIADPHILRLIASTIKRETKAALDREAK